MNLQFTVCWLVVASAVIASLADRSRSPWVSLTAILLPLAVLTVLLPSLIGSVARPHFPSGAGPFLMTSDELFVASWWLLAARAALVVGRLALRINHKSHPARLASDLVGGAIYLGALLAVLDLAFGVSLTGLVATSGIIAIVLGLALQSTLGDLFSGIAIGVDRPYAIGDSIWIEGSIEGRVVETNWRSTRVVTSENDIATVPNSVIAKSRILNRSYPTEMRTDKVSLVLDPAVFPIDGISLLTSAALNVNGTGNLPFTVICTDLSGDAATYDISFSAPSSRLATVRSDLLQQVARHARYGGVALGSRHGRAVAPAIVPTVGDLLDAVHVLQPLQDRERDALASRIVSHAGTPGGTIYDQGGTAASLFVIARGTFEVTRDDGGGARRIGLFGPGDYFGELSLLAGLENAVTVRGLTHYLAYEVTKGMIAPLLQDNPLLLQALQQGASKARSLLERGVAAQASAINAGDRGILDRVRAFFAIQE